MTKLVPKQFATTLPAHLQTGVATGNENITADDIQIPRIKLLQKMSPEIDEGSPRFIPAAKPGMLLNSVTNETSEEIYCMNMFFESGVTVFKQRDLGGGFFGNFLTEDDAKNALTREGMDIGEYDIAATHTHTLLLINAETMTIEMPAVMDFASSKLKVSRSWNSDLQLKCGNTTPRFGAIYRMFGKMDRNPKGQTWHNVDFTHVGWADAKMFEEASNHYERMHSSKVPAAA
jgi:hypothetical protein